MEIGSGPETAVFFLPRGVGEHEVVRDAIDGTGYGVGVFWRGVSGTKGICSGASTMYLLWDRI